MRNQKLIAVCMLGGATLGGLMVLALLTLAPTPVQAQYGTSTTEVLQAFAGEVLTVTNAQPFGFTPATSYGAGAKRAQCTTETNILRYRTDGTNASTTVGHSVAAGTTFTIDGSGNLSRFRSIAASGNVPVFCTYSK